MTVQQIKDKLLNSQAVQSLYSEKHIYDILTKLDWKSVHSAFYEDKNSGKNREIDVVGKRSWQCKLKTKEIISQVSLLVEAKSASNYHLVFSPLKNYPKWENNHSYWCGYDESNPYFELINKFVGKGLSTEEAEKINNELHSIAWPQQMIRPMRLSIPPPSASVYTSSFTETNVGNGRELDNSVMWKASRSLNTAMQNLMNQHADREEDLNLEIECALKSGEKPMQAILDHLTLSLSFIWIYHPIIVIDSDLWVIQNKDLNLINWCRFLQLSPFGHQSWWFDVVNSKYFEEYANYVTSYYKKTYRSKKAVIFK